MGTTTDEMNDDAITAQLTKQIDINICYTLLLHKDFFLATPASVNVVKAL